MSTTTKKDQNFIERTFTKFGISSAVGYTFVGLFSVIILGALAVAGYFIVERLLKETQQRQPEDLSKKYEPLVKGLTGSAASFPKAALISDLDDLAKHDDKDLKEQNLKDLKRDAGDIKLVHSAISRMMSSKLDEFENQNEIDAWLRIKGKYSCFSNLAEIKNAEREILTRAIPKLKSERDNARNKVNDLAIQLAKVQEKNSKLLDEWDAKSEEEKTQGEPPEVTMALQEEQNAKNALKDAEKAKNESGIALGNAQKNLKALSVKPPSGKPETGAKPPGPEVLPGGKPPGGAQQIVPPSGAPPGGAQQIVPPSGAPPGGAQQIVPPTGEPPGSKPPPAQSPSMELDLIREEITEKKRESFDEYLNKLRSEKSELFTGLSNLLDYCKVGWINFVSLVLACLDPSECKPKFITGPFDEEEIIGTALKFIDKLASPVPTFKDGKFILDGLKDILKNIDLPQHFRNA